MTREETRKELEAALLALSADPSLGYLAVTSKPELPVRDRAAWYFHRKHPRLIAAREYRVELGRGPGHSKRVDLALLNDSPDPVVLIEFKAMIVPDALGSNAGHRLVKELARDLKKLDDLRRIQRLGVMLMVHIENLERLERPGLNEYVVKYLGKFRSRSTELDALREAIANTHDFFDQAKLEVSPITVDLGSVWGAGVKLICFIAEPR